MLDFGVQSQSSDTRPKTSCIGSLAVDCRQSLRHRQDEELAEERPKSQNPQHVQDMGIARARISVPARCCSRHLHHCAATREALAGPAAGSGSWKVVGGALCAFLYVRRSARQLLVQKRNLGVAVVVLPCLR